MAPVETALALALDRLDAPAEGDDLGLDAAPSFARARMAEELHALSAALKAVSVARK
jgi:hypothetical protein